MSASARSPAASRNWILLAPMATAASYVLWTFPESGGHWTVVVRPGLAAVLVAAALEAALWLEFRRADRAAVLATLAVLLLAQHPTAAFLLGYLALVGLSGWWFVRVRKVWTRWLPIVAPVTIVSWSLLLVSVVVVFTSGSVPLSDVNPWTTSVHRDPDPSLPNVYVILLDGYPRSDTLKDVYQYDNSEFLDGLQIRGFDVYAGSQSDYDQTRLTLLSMLSGNVGDGLRFHGVARTREFRRLMSEAPALAELHEAGYGLVTIRSPIVEASASGWDRIIDSGQVNDFEVVLLSRLRFGSLFREWILDQHRERIGDTLTSAAALATRSDQVAVLVHVLSPHPPFLFAADGTPADPSYCWPGCGLYGSRVERHPIGWEGYRVAMVDQIRALNHLVTSTVDRIVETDGDAVVIAMSDHGTRYSDDQAERHANLFAARTPGHGMMFATSPTPRDLFHRVLAAYAIRGD